MRTLATCHDRCQDAPQYCRDADRDCLRRLDRCHADVYGTDMQTTGRELRIERVTSDVTLTAIAARMKLSRQALWALERSAVVRPDRAQQYREALRDVKETL